MPVIVSILTIAALAGIIMFIDFVNILFNHERTVSRKLLRVVEILVMVCNPALFIFLFDVGTINECCGDSAFFSPAHRITVYIIIGLSLLAYFYSTFREKTAPPLVELLLNIMLLTGLLLAISIGVHSADLILWLPGIPAISFGFLSQLIINHRLMLLEVNDPESVSRNQAERLIRQLLSANQFIKYPLLLLLALPVLLLLSLILFIFGQQPDSLVRAFTDTYKHGFSQWDYQCENVQCGGHYLCSVAANGHKTVVKPVRIGKRHGHFITCNRQLLVSNAFEELIQEKWPGLHRLIRKQYDKVGDMIHDNYSMYANKWVADLVYVLMKPAEWLFVLVLYMADRKPEQRIARQYAAW